MRKLKLLNLLLLCLLYSCNLLGNDTSEPFVFVDNHFAKLTECNDPLTGEDEDNVEEVDGEAKKTEGSVEEVDGEAKKTEDSVKEVEGSITDEDKVDSGKPKRPKKMNKLAKLFQLKKKDPTGKLGRLSFHAPREDERKDLDSQYQL